jgi:hypothetical protein
MKSKKEKSDFQKLVQAMETLVQAMETFIIACHNANCTRQEANKAFEKMLEAAKLKGYSNG